MNEKQEMEFDILMEVYGEELFEIAKDNAQLEGVCACEDIENGDKNFDFDLHDAIETLFLYALRDGDLDQFEILLLFNDSLISVDMEEEEEEEGDVEDEGIEGEVPIISNILKKTHKDSYFKVAGAEVRVYGNWFNNSLYNILQVMELSTGLFLLEIVDKAEVTTQEEETIASVIEKCTTNGMSIEESLKKMVSDVLMGAVAPPVVVCDCEGWCC